MLDYFQNLIANCASKWRPVVGYEGLYEVSMDGEVRSLDRITEMPRRREVRKYKGKILRPGASGYGYPIVVLCKNGVTKSCTVHRLLVEAHRGPIPFGMDIDHINGNPTDNSLGNLRVVTTSQNVRNKTKTWNRHGHRGVHFRDRGVKKWVARIKAGEKVIHIGCFLTLEEASKARIDAEVKYWGNDAPSVVRK